jgi:hypothetical protein
MSDGPYDFAREWEAEAEAIGGTRRRGVYMHDEDDMPDERDA